MAICDIKYVLAVTQAASKQKENRIAPIDRRIIPYESRLFDDPTTDEIIARLATQKCKTNRRAKNLWAWARWLDW